MSGWTLIPWTFQYLISSAIILFVTLYVYKKSPKVLSTKFFAVFGLLVMTWQLFVFLHRNAPNESLTRVFTYIFMFSGNIAFGFIILSVLAIIRFERYYYLSFLPLLPLFITPVLTNPFTNSMTTNYGWTYEFNNAFYLATIFSFFVYSILYTVLGYYLVSKHQELKKKISLIIIGWVGVNVIGTSISNIYLNMYPDTPPIGGFIATIGFLIVAYGISIKPEVKFSDTLFERGYGEIAEEYFKFIKSLQKSLPGSELGESSKIFREFLKNTKINEVIGLNNGKRVIEPEKITLDKVEEIPGNILIFSKEHDLKIARLDEFEDLTVSTYNLLKEEEEDAEGWFQSLLEEHGHYLDKMGVLNNLPREIEIPKMFLELQEKRRKIEQLHSTANKLAECDTIEEIYDITLNASKNVLDFYLASILISEEDKLVVKATNDEDIEVGTELSIEEGIYGRSYRENESYLVNNIHEDEDADPARNELNSLLSVPIGSYGVFQAISNQKNFFDESDLDLAELLVSHMEEAINRLNYEKNLMEKEERYRTLFEESPISLWEEDYSEVKDYLDALKEEGVKDFEKYFDENPEEVKKCAEMVNILDINKHTLELYGIKSKNDLENHLPKLLGERGLKDFKETLLALAKGRKSYTGEAINYTFDGEEKIVNIKWSVPSDYQEGYSRVLVSIMDITDRKDTEEELEEYRNNLESLVEERTRELEELNEQLKSFTHSVSHDLRAPLRAMEGFSNALIEDYADDLDENGKMYANRISKAAKRMDKLIQDLLDYSNLTRGELKLKAVDLQQAINDAVLNNKDNIEKKNAKINLRFEDYTVKAHRSTLVQVMSNLISNAVKFTDDGTKPIVTIKCKEMDGKIRITVSDNGIGIPEEKRDQIFQMFERLHGIESYTGTGVGLALVKKGVERMDGSIGFQSEVGKGSTFWVELPKAE